jgi:uncharacterized protein YjhX (UPF0386 family)
MKKTPQCRNCFKNSKLHDIRAFQTLSIILISCYIRNEYAIATSDKAVFRNTKEINVIDQNVQ